MPQCRSRSKPNSVAFGGDCNTLGGFEQRLEPNPLLTRGIGTVDFCTLPNTADRFYIALCKTLLVGGDEKVCLQKFECQQWLAAFVVQVVCVLNQLVQKVMDLGV